MWQIKKTGDSDKHSYDVNSLVFYNESIYSGADDGKIMLWSTDLEKRSEVEAHPSSIYSIVALNNHIYSCSNDGTLKVWSLDLKPVSTLINLSNEFWKLAVWENNLFVGDDQGIVRIFENNQLKGNYGILEPIKDMTVDKNTIYSVNSSDVVVTEVNPEKKNSSTCRQMIPGRAPLCFLEDKLVITDGPAKGMSLINTKLNFTISDTIENAHELIILALCGIKGKDGDIYVFSGGWDKTIKKWKIANDKFELVSSTSLDIVINCMIIINETTMYAAGGDGHILKINF